ncbi:hypothetical protein HK103_002866 [Boothiomyces macroporosus]|uniref:Uncharacterized protein n=1 Tax=Boothiomyces macroporosus TaxID=261099 RepID=A0AAD5Y9F8_9FUNG|nr:hypothetical protein HK103_002866 [Boothiomyces macroporosus]
MAISVKTQELLLNTTNKLLKSNNINRFNFASTIYTLLSTRSSTTKQLNQLSNYYRNNPLDKNNLLAYYRLAAVFPLKVHFKPTNDTQMQAYLMYLSAIYFKNNNLQIDYKKVNDLRTWHQLYLYSIVFKKENLEIKKNLEQFTLKTEKSMLEKFVQKHLYKLKVKGYERQVTCEKTKYTFDYLIGNKVIEVQGPSHYIYIDGYRVPSMKTRLKTMIVKQYYDFEVIEYFKWNAMSATEKEEYVSRRKNVEKLVVENPVPTLNQQIAKVKTIRGNQLFDCTLPSGEEYLVQLPPQFINKVFVKLNGFVIIELEKSGKIDGQIVHVLFKEDLKHLKKLGLLPAEFDDTRQEQEDDLFVNNNRIVDSDEEEY